MLLFITAIIAMGAAYGAGFVTAERVGASLEGGGASQGLVDAVSSLPQQLRVTGESDNVIQAPSGAGSAESQGALVSEQEGQAGSSDPAAEPGESFTLFWEALEAVRTRHVGEPLDEHDATYGAIRGSLRSLDDPYTLFSDPVDTAVSQPELEGEFEGIGAYVTANEDGLLMIQTPMRGQPAEEAGVRAGDLVIKVDGQDITEMDVNESVLLIRGPKGTTVTLTILRQDEAEPLEIAVVRDRIDIPSVTNVKTLEALGAPNVGYMQLTVFAAETKEELVGAIDELTEAGAEALVLDLRNNPGGYLNAAIDVTSQFVDDVVVVQQEDFSGRRVAMEAEGGGHALDIPLVVLVNKGSASASEIVAGAIQDLDRGVLVGEQTFGKGSVQNVHELSDKSQLRVTVAVWLTPDGKLIHKEGVVPDIVIEPPPRPTVDPDAEAVESTPTPVADVDDQGAGGHDGGESQADDVQLLRAIEEALRLIGAA